MNYYKVCNASYGGPLTHIVFNGAHANLKNAQFYTLMYYKLIRMTLSMTVYELI